MKTNPTPVSDRPTHHVCNLTERSMLTEIWKSWKEIPPPIPRHGRYHGLE